MILKRPKHIKFPPLLLRIRLFQHPNLKIPSFFPRPLKFPTRYPSFDINSEVFTHLLYLRIGFFLLRFPGEA